MRYGQGLNQRWTDEHYYSQQRPYVRNGLEMMFHKGVGYKDTYLHMWAYLNNDSRPVAYMKLREDKNKLFICTIEVRPDMRKRGLATRLYKELSRSGHGQLARSGTVTSYALKASSGLVKDERGGDKGKADTEELYYFIDWSAPDGIDRLSIY